MRRRVSVKVNGSARRDFLRRVAHPLFYNHKLLNDFIQELRGIVENRAEPITLKTAKRMAQLVRNIERLLEIQQRQLTPIEDFLDELEELFEDNPHAEIW